MQPNPTRPTVLVVDDERGPRESLRMILEPVCDVRVARSGSEALDTMRDAPVDLLTLDLNMPGMRGEEVMRCVRSEHPDTEIIVITGAGSVASASESVRAGICDYLTKPFDVVQVSAAIGRAISRRRSRERLTGFLSELGAVVDREREAEHLVADVRRSQKLRGRLTGIFDEHGGLAAGDDDAVMAHPLQFLEVLAETIETKGAFMRGHARRVSLFSALLATRLGLPPAELELVRIAGFLHDVGLVGVPTELLTQDRGLEPMQREVLEKHPVVGSRLMLPLDLSPTVAQAIRHHHEWWNGTGYPDGLAGEEIPLAARIVAITDAFDAMSGDRPYREALPRDVVVSEFERYSGVQFDPELTKEFLGLLEDGHCDVELELLGEVLASAWPGPASDD